MIFPAATLQKCFLFADDTTVIIKCQDKNDYKLVIEKTLSDILNWIESNNLNINISKKKIIHINSYNTKQLALDVICKDERV